MISVLCPSRGRPGRAVESCQSFGSQDIEFLVAVDKDDGQLDAYKETSLSLTICPRYGYDNLEKYYNTLAKQAKGDWLFNWNDDAYCHHDDVESLLDLDPAKPWVVLFGEDKCFPMISRGLYALIGHFAAGPSVDSYIHAIGTHGGIIVDRPTLGIAHDRFNDATTKEHNYEKMDERMASEKVVNQRLADIKKILEAKQ